MSGESEGKGVYRWPEGDRYVGDWKKGERHGFVPFSNSFPFPNFPFPFLFLSFLRSSEFFFFFSCLPACPLKRRSNVHWSVFSSFLKTQKSENSMFCECSVLTFLWLHSFLPSFSDLIWSSFFPHPQPLFCRNRHQTLSRARKKGMNFLSFVRHLLTHISLLIHPHVWMMIFCSLDPLLFIFHVVLADLDCGCSCLVMVAALWLWWLLHGF